MSVLKKSRGRSGRFATILFTAAVAAAPTAAFAVPTWTSGSATTDNWNDPDNWAPAAVPVAGNDVIFDNTAQGLVDGVNTVDTSFTVGTLSFNTTSSAAFSTTIPGGSVLQVDGNVGTTLDTADFNVGHDLTNDAINRTVNLTVAGAGTLQIGATTAASTDLVISRRGPAGAGSMTVNLDMSGLTQFNAYVDEFAVSIGGGANLARADSVIRLAQASDIRANTMTIGHHTGSGGANTDGAVLRFGQTTDLRANAIYFGRQKQGATVTFDTGLTSPTLNITSRSGGGADLFIGYNDNSNTGTTPTSIFDVTNAGGSGTVNFTATLDDVVIGRHIAGGGYGRGEFKMNTGTVTANSLVLAQTGTSSNPLNTHGRLTMGGGSFTVAGDIIDSGGQSFINVTAGTIAGSRRLRVDELNVGVGGGVATLGTRMVGQQNNRQVTTLQLGANTTWNNTLTGAGTSISNTNATVDGTLNVAVEATPAASVADADRTAWFAGTGTWDTDGDKWERGLPAGFAIANAQVVPLINTTGTLTDNGLSLATAGWTLNVTPGAAGSVAITRTGGDIVSAPVKAYFDATSSVVTRATPLTIANDAARVDATGIQMAAGTLTATAPVTLGSATANGAVEQTGGTIAFNGGLLDGGAGESSVRVDGGSFSVTGGVTLDALPFVATSGRTGSFTASGGAVAIDSSGNIDVGYRGTDTGSHTVGTLDLSAATSTDITAAIFRGGRINTGPATGQASAIIKLSTAGTNTLTANSVILGESANAANSNPTTTFQFGGGANNFSANTFIIAGNKSKATVTIGSGGNVTLAGRTGALTDLLIGENNINTGTVSTGILDTTGGTFDAALDELVIGRHGQGSGGGKGTFIMAAGNVSATSILLASGSNGGTSSNPANIAGTLQFTGGTITAGSVSKGIGTATFDWTGGTLAVGAFGFDITQNGATANLSPGGPSAVGQTAVTGGYTLTSGRWAIGLDGSTGTADVVNVSGLLDLSGAADALDVSVLAGSPNGQTFVIASYGTLSGTFNTENLSALPPGSTVDYAYQGNQIAVVVVPEPASIALLALATGGLLARRRRR